MSNTQRYVIIADHVFEYEEDGYTTRVATNVKGTRTLREAGFEYVMHLEDCVIFRKR